MLVIPLKGLVSNIIITQKMAGWIIYNELDNSEDIKQNKITKKMLILLLYAIHIDNINMTYIISSSKVKNLYSHTSTGDEYLYDLTHM